MDKPAVEDQDEDSETETYRVPYGLYLWVSGLYRMSYGSVYG